MADDIQPKFPKPKILLVDLPDEATARLAATGFNVQPGTFGRPYHVPVGDGFLPLIGNADLPNHTEQEVVIIDLTTPPTADEPPGKKETSVADPTWWASNTKGRINPRQMAMSAFTEDWDRILNAGGIFVLFAQPRSREEYVYGTGRAGVLRERDTRQADNWSFLSLLGPANLHVESDHGTEATVLESVDSIEAFLRGHLDGLEFDATLAPGYILRSDASQWAYHKLIENKYGEGIGGAIYSTRHGGRILVLPQVKDKVRAVVELVTTVLPEAARHLFPDTEPGRWAHGDEYEHPSVLERKQAQQRALAEARATFDRLELEIEAERKQFGYLHALLTATGDELVAATKKALEVVGFAPQTPAEESEPGKNKQEDIQLLDRSPALLLEVKGIGSKPGEADAQQVNKYVLRRAKQWGRTDIRGVFLVNHERNLPALQRDDKNVFTEQQIIDAVEGDTGLMTTWDLFRLVRGLLRWKWPKERVQDVFYHRGRLPAVPSHYEPVGVVAHFFDKASAVSVEVGKPGLRVGDTVGYLLPAGFVEERITSLQVNKANRQEAKEGERAGYKTGLKRSDLPDGTTVYFVRAHA